MSRRPVRLAHVFHEHRTERTIETGANEASRLRGGGNRGRLLESVEVKEPFAPIGVKVSRADAVFRP
jgi:hypothetical protein